MTKMIDDVLHEAQALQPLIQKYQNEFTEGGMGPDRIAPFQTAFADAMAKDAAQKTAQAVMMQRTQAQDLAADRARLLISIIQNAAKAAFYNDKVKLKEFRIGMMRNRNLKELISALEYFSTVVKKYEADLLINGLRREDMDSVSSVSTELLTTDGVQENSKKLRNAATAERDVAVKLLRTEVFRIRRFAFARFAHDPGKLEEFQSVNVSRRKSNTATPASDPATQELVGAGAKE